MPINRPPVAPQPSRTARGREAEEKARCFLEGSGLQLITSNYHAPCGEIDLVMSDGDTIVFVEVRLRRPSRFGDAIESVSARKCARIVATAEHYLQRHPLLANRPCRFDVVAFTGKDVVVAEPRWLQGAFGV